MPSQPSSTGPRAVGIDPRSALRRRTAWTLACAISFVIMTASFVMTWVEHRAATGVNATTILIDGLVRSSLLGAAAIFCLLVQRRRRSEHALKTSEERFHLLVEGMEDHAIYMLDLQGNVVTWNVGAERITGYHTSEILGKSFVCFYPAADIERGKPQADLKSAAESGRVELEDWRVRKDGRSLWADVVITVLRDEDGLACGFCQVTRDRTERKQAELLEQDRRHMLEMVAQNQPLGEVVAQLIGMVQRQYPRMIASVLLLSEGRLQQAGASRLPERFAADLATESAAVTSALMGSHRSTVMISEIASDPNWAALGPAAARDGLNVAALIPLLSGSGKLLGALAAWYDGQSKPQTSELELLKTVARLGALAIEHRQVTDQLAYQAQHDQLTGLPNRVLLEDRMQQALLQSRRDQKLVALFFIDLDRFKVINDTLGHEAGDLFLRQVALRFKSCVRQTDTLVRMGGDEFTLVLPGLADRQEAVKVAQKLLHSLESPMEVAGHELFASASIGIVVYPQDGSDAAELQKNADTAMYRAKKAGRNCIECFAPEMNTAAMERLDLEGQLRRAIVAREFTLHYQPQVQCDGRLIGFEALMRWNHPRLGMIPPTKFIPLAEDTGLIVPLGLWVLRESCRQAKLWQEHGYAPIRMAVNVSVIQFAQKDFVSNVLDALESSGLDGQWLEVELTESVLMHDTQNGAEKLNQLRASGVGIAIDDFGMGYSSLAYLQRLPIDTLKIDGSFVREISAGGRDAAVVRAINSLAHTLEMKVIAEGVENESQRLFLEQIGCDAMQGFLFSRPKAASEIEVMMAKDVRREHALSA